MNYSLAEPLLKLENVSLSFGEKENKKKVLRDINIEIKDIIGETTTGQVVTLLGKSGAGKTTLLRIIAGLIQPTTGSVLIGKQQLPVVAGVVGMVLQTYPLFAHRTLMENLLLVCKDKAKIESYLEDFDIYQHKDKYPSKLSGGQRQRTAILQQLLCSEHYILLDEPFSGLDPVAIEKLCKILTKVVNADDQNTLIISSHILEPSIAISDTIWMIGNEYDGDKKLEGSVIRYTEDLAAEGFAWNPEIRKDPKFRDAVERVRELFHTL